MVIKKLKEIANVEMGLSPKGETYNNNGVGLPLLNGPTEFGDKYPHSTLYTTDSKREAQKGDIIFCVRGSTTGRMNFADKVYSLGRGVCSIRGKNDKETKYIKFVLDYKLKHLLKFANGGTFPNLCRDDILGFEVPYNNVEKVSMLLSNYDDLIENNNKRIKILEEMAQKIYKEWFVDFKFPNHETATFKQTELGEIPNDWEVFPFEDFISFQEGPGIRNWQYVNENGINFVNIRCINNNILNTSNTSQISKEEAYGKYKHFLLNENDIIMSTSGTLGKWAIIQKHHLPLCLNTSIIRFTPKLNDNDYSYILGYLKSTTFNNYLTSMATGSAQVNFGPIHLKQIKIIKPNRIILDKYHKIIEPLTKERLLVISKNQTLKQTRDLLLPRLISGEIDVENMEIV